VLFERRLREGIQDGSITVAFRRWKRSQVVAGHRYCMGAGAGLALVSSVATVHPSEIADADARAAGFASREALLADLGNADAGELYCICFAPAPEPDPRDALAAIGSLSLDEVAELDRRLDKLDSTGKHGAWTRATLRCIADSPGVRAGDLAPRLGWSELQDFKLHVRKLKALGLTTSLLVGYELSPRGAAYLELTLRRS
jgi:hypothetical protein